MVNLINWTSLLTLHFDALLPARTGDLEQDVDVVLNKYHGLHPACMGRRKASRRSTHLKNGIKLSRPVARREVRGDALPSTVLKHQPYAIAVRPLSFRVVFKAHLLLQGTKP